MKPVGETDQISDMKLCVYTAITGGYEKALGKLPENCKDIPFICLTDDHTLRSDEWDVRCVEGLFQCDAMRNQRELKINPHKYLSEYDCSIYIDNSVLLKIDPWQLYKEIFKGAQLALFQHSYRNTVFDEFVAVMKAGLDDVDRIKEQLIHYKNSDSSHVLDEKPFWGGLIYRDHRSAAVRRMSEVWAGHVFRYARRDQLSLNYALRIANIQPNVIPHQIHESFFHQWPREHAGRIKKKKVAFYKRVYFKLNSMWMKRQARAIKRSR